jgi:uncharacterized repeat protein (TIGR02543 family)
MNTDAYYYGSGTIRANAAVTDDKIKTLDVYINSQKTGTFPISNNKASFEISTAGMHTLTSGRRNVILVIARGSDGSVAGKAYLTLGVSKPLRTVTYSPGGETGISPNTASYAEGTIINLPVNTFTRDGYTFIGWTDNINTYSAGIEYTVGSGDILFTALWRQNDAVSGGFPTAAIIIPVAVSVVIAACAGLYIVFRKKRKDGTR